MTNNNSPLLFEEFVLVFLPIFFISIRFLKIIKKNNLKTNIDLSMKTMF